MDSIASVALHTSEAVEYGEEAGKVVISLPRMFNLSDELIRHIIILKNPGSETNYNYGENNVVLLTTEIEREIDIPDQRIFSLPKALSVTRFSVLFNGIQFNSDQFSDSAGSLVLLLNCEGVNRFAQKEEVL